jgi:hypothetical protein
LLRKTIQEIWRAEAVYSLSTHQFSKNGTLFTFNHNEQMELLNRFTVHQLLPLNTENVVRVCLSSFYISGPPSFFWQGQTWPKICPYLQCTYSFLSTKKCGYVSVSSFYTSGPPSFFYKDKSWKKFVQIYSAPTPSPQHRKCGSCLSL